MTEEKFLALEYVRLGMGIGVQLYFFSQTLKLSPSSCPCPKPRFHWKICCTKEWKKVLELFRFKSAGQPQGLLGGSAWSQWKNNSKWKVIELGVIPIRCWFSEHEMNLNGFVCLFVFLNVIVSLKLEEIFWPFWLLLEKRGPN